MTGEFRNPAKLPTDLNSAEKNLIDCVAKGVACKVGNGELPDPETPIITGAVNVIRGEVIRFLAYNSSVLGDMIHLQGAWISGNLNLSNANIPFALVFTHCHFAFKVHMLHMECHGLYMNGCHLAKGLNGYGMKAKESVFLRHLRNKYDRQTPFSANGEVQLVGVHVGGDLDCRGGEFDNPEGSALDANRITVKGNVLLSCGFSAKGEVCLLGADIGGQLDCAGGIFVNKGDSKYALNAERIKTKGHVYLNQHASGGKISFVANGRVRFANADIGGNFNCKGGQFNHLGERSALAAGGLRSRAVFLSDGFSAKGEVALHVAHIGNFVCTGCKPNDKSPTTINLLSTKSAAVDDDENSWKPFEFILDGFTYDTFYGHSPIDPDIRLKWLAKRPGTRRLKDGRVPLPFSPLPYEQAARVLRIMGKDIDAWNIEREKNRLQREFDGVSSFRKFGGWLLDTLKDAGYYPSRIVKWGLCVMAFGAAVFACADYHGNIVPTHPVVAFREEYWGKIAPNGDMRPTQAVPPEYPAFNPLMFSVDVFTPSAVFHQEDSWGPRSGGGDWKDFDFDILWLLTLWYWLEVAMGWILTSMLLLSVTGLLRPRQSPGEKD